MFDYMLVFAAVFIGCVYSIKLIQSIAVEREELKKKKGEDFTSNNPIERFISLKSLLQVQLFVAISCFGVFACIFVFTGVPLYVGGPLSLVLAAAAFFLPYGYYYLKVLKRKNVFEDSILDLTMGLTNGLRGGMALPQSLENFVRRAEGPIREELLIVLREYKLGVDLGDALERLHSRMPCEDLRILITSIRLTSKAGGSLVDVLVKMTEMIRSRREFHEKLKTMTAQGRFEAIAIALAPLAAFIILYVMDTELMAPMLQSPIGWASLGAVVVLEIIGFWVINKIVTIEV